MNLVRLQYGGGGGELHGASVIVTTEEPTLVGKQAKLYKKTDLTKVIATGTFSAKVNDVSTATLNGILDVGTYIVKATDGTQSTETEDIIVTADDIINKITLPPIEMSFSFPKTLTVYSARNATIVAKTSTGKTLGSCTTSNDSEGKATLTILIQGNGENITFEDTNVAPSTDGSGSHYSKTIFVNKNTTEARIYPDNTIYWYGNEVNCEDCYSSSVWSSPKEAMLKDYGVSVVFQTNYCDVALNRGGGICGLGAKNAINNCTKAYIIAKVSTTHYNGEYKRGYFGVANSKVVSDDGSGLVNITANDYTKYSVDMSDNQYPFVESISYGGAFVQAMWCE